MFIDRIGLFLFVDLLIVCEVYHVAQAASIESPDQFH